MAFVNDFPVSAAFLASRALELTELWFEKLVKLPLESPQRTLCHNLERELKGEFSLPPLVSYLEAFFKAVEEHLETLESIIRFQPHTEDSAQIQDIIAPDKVFKLIHRRLGSLLHGPDVRFIPMVPVQWQCGQANGRPRTSRSDQFSSRAPRLCSVVEIKRFRDECLPYQKHVSADIAVDGLSRGHIEPTDKLGTGRGFCWVTSLRSLDETLDPTGEINPATVARDALGLEHYRNGSKLLLIKFPDKINLGQVARPSIMEGALAPFMPIPNRIWGETIKLTGCPKGLPEAVIRPVMPHPDNGFKFEALGEIDLIGDDILEYLVTRLWR
jgi:hypothetical protein